MPDAPDYYQYALSGKRHILNDQAELAARLGSIVNFDRTGQVVFASGFENGIAPFYGVNVSGSTNRLLSTPTFLGDYCYEIRSVAAPFATFGQMGKTFAPNEYNKWGLQTAVSFTAAFNYFSLSFIIDNGINLRTATIKYAYSTGIWSLLNNAGTYTTFLTRTITPPNSGYFHAMKMVIDTVTKQYLRLKLDDYEVGLSDYTYYEQGTASNPNYSVVLELGVNNGQTVSAYIDHMVITTGEI